MLNSKSLGNRIATARKKNNLSQADLAQRVSISSQAVGKWERGESMPDITTLNRLAEIFSVDLNYFSENFQNDTVAEQEKNVREPEKILLVILLKRKSMECVGICHREIGQMPTSPD